MTSRIVKSGVGSGWMFNAGPHLVAMSCHHKREGACGGCYARAIRFVEDVAKGGRCAAGAEALLNEIRSEAK